MKSIPKKFSLYASLVIFLSALVVFAFFLKTPPSLQPVSYPEIQDLADRTKSFNELKTYFKDLAQKKGAVYAYKVLIQAPMPPNIDMHLLGHVVGEILYLQKGAAGISYCTPDFRNACSHTIVVGLFLDKGEAALKEINSACRKAPGGSGAYLMCHHGLGHGILAFTNYDLKKTVELCKKTGTESYQFKEYPECVGGAIMEQISGGDHDPQTWARQRQVNLSESDPLYPCNSDIIPEQEAKKLCYIYLTPHLFNLAGTKVADRPNNENIIKAFGFCDALPKNDSRNRDVCFGGFGKEFVVFARDRDIRKIDTMTKMQLQRVSDWCSLSKVREGVRSCIQFSVGSLFWGGENNRTTAINFCNLIIDPENQLLCFTALTNNVATYIKDEDYRQEYCDEVPKDAKEYCQKKLL